MNGKRLFRCLALLGLCLLGGCSSVAKGVTEAVLEHNADAEDTRLCEIDGPAFGGVRDSLNEQSPEKAKVTKILMVHGINSHMPGYSTRFQKKLFEKLGLTVMDATIKTIDLDSNDLAWAKGEEHNLGSLRVTRHMNEDGSKQVIFYELTWSPITEAQKQMLAADTANNEGLPRASLNNSLKGFMNSTVPDLLIYNGNGFNRITTAVMQSVCWMMADSWQGLPAEGRHDCPSWPQSTFAGLRYDDHFFVTHSLGSRITIDMVQKFTTQSRDTGTPNDENVAALVRQKEVTVFMLANQLPLLQMGRSAPAVSNALADYCGDNAPKAKNRVMKRMDIVAFSDPNDILSYPVPMDFTRREIDSRICPSVTNVSLNVAEQKNLFDAASFANPLQAHSGYMEDDRVIDLIADGLGRNKNSPQISGHCKWVETR